MIGTWTYLNVNLPVNILDWLQMWNTHTSTYRHNNTAKHYMPHRCLQQAGAQKHCCQIINPLYTEQTLPHYILEESNFNFRYTRLWDLHILGEKWLNYLQTVETLIRCRVLQHLIWVCIVCQLPFYGSPDYNGLMENIFSWNFIFSCWVFEYSDMLWYFFLWHIKKHYNSLTSIY